MKTVITKEILENLLEQGFSSNQIGKQLGYSGVGIRYYMKKWLLSSIHASIQDKTCYITDTHKQCPKCSEIKELNNFDKRPNGNVQSYCRKCCNDNRYSIIKQHKLTILNELGNCCSNCGYNKNTSALEFHHLEPEHKDFHFGSTKTTNIDKIRKELEKCILVCANCHREIHYPQNNKTI
jgi:hypothetical protein